MSLPTDWKAADTRLEGKRFLWGREGGIRLFKSEAACGNTGKQAERQLLCSPANKRLTNAPSRGNPGREFHY